MCVVSGNESRLAGLAGTQRSPVNIPGVSVCVPPFLSHHTHIHGLASALAATL